MNKVFNQKILYFIPIIFLIAFIFIVYFNYLSAKENAYNFAKKEAEVLSSYAEAHRNYYQKLYINEVIELNEKTFLGLPAYSSSIISRVFSKDNILNIKIKSVSDRARNPLNQADKSELKAIEYFKNNSDKKQNFDDTNSEFYQFSKVLKIERKCLKCHDKKEKAPFFIQKKYDRAYDYNIGDIRGIISIKLPKSNINNYFIKYFLYSSFYDFLLLILLLSIVYYLAQKSKKMNEILEKEVDLKTSELKRTLMYDRLTGLPNRLSLIDDIKNINSEHVYNLAILNIDSFKDINDLYGHEIGDSFLQKVANILHKIAVGKYIKIYKLPSDEFAILSKKEIIKSEFIQKIKIIMNSLQEKEYSIKDNTIFIRLSCGVASTKKNLLIKSDMALKTAKYTKKSLVVYESFLDRKNIIIKNINGIALIKNAMLRDTIIPYFQPIYDLKLKQITKYEALVRIVDNDNNVHTPIEFLDIAYKAKLNANITQTMIEKTFEFFKDKEFEFSINLSIIDISDHTIYDFIIKKLSTYASSDRVVFEILENDKIDNYDELNRFIKNIKKFGCKVAIDDFGKGYSNFSHLLELNVDYLKIDASLVKNILVDKNSSKIVQTIVYFAQNLDIKTIAEYVENKEILDALEAMGVDFIQGYYIGKPEKKLIS